MSQSLGPPIEPCRGHCPEHPICSGQIRERYLVDTHRTPDEPAPLAECDVCGAWFTKELVYLRHRPRLG
jgi:hypothetical protein